MPDIVDSATRSRMMSGIRGRDTKPEILIRKGLFRHGFRYRLHVRNLPGKPDLVLARYHAVVLIHGCFWHGHDCRLFKWPSTNDEFWQKKIGRNRERDCEVRNLLKKEGWRVLTIWECSFRGKGSDGLEQVVQRAADWIRSDKRTGTIRGKRCGR